MKKRSLVHGVAINDSPYKPVQTKVIDGKQKIIWHCPYHNRWVRMLGRCYSDGQIKRNPSYMGCTVCDEWLLFSNFAEWMKMQPWEGKQIDKDILVPGNKVYSPEFCVFVDRQINTFIIDRTRGRGKYLIGACKIKGKFEARCSNPETGIQERLGLFKTEMEAHLAWKARKHEIACKYADLQKDPRVAKALKLRYALSSDYIW